MGSRFISPRLIDRNAAKIKAAGAKLKNLVNAIAFELPNSRPLRAEHIRKNADLVRGAGGLLAPVSGMERYITLGCSHTAAFCKTAQLARETSAVEL